jgi:hypothetical protein
LREYARQGGARGAEKDALAQDGKRGEAKRVVVGAAAGSVADDGFDENQVVVQSVTDQSASGVGIISQLAYEEVGDPSGVGAERGEQ